MANITSEYLKNCEVIGSGCFGVVYRRGNKAYKVYREEIKDDFKEPADNPVLTNPGRTFDKLNRLIRLNSLIEYSDLAEDILYVDNKLSGVVLPYYDGKLFYDIVFEPIENRITYARELLRNARELTSHNIYPLDHRLKNIMLVNGEVKIIDLDDYYSRVTRFVNPYYYFRSISALDDSIKSFFREYERASYNQAIMQRIERQTPKCNLTYGGISKYIDFKSEKHRLLFIDENFRLNDEMLINGSRVIIVYDRLYTRKMLEVIDKLNQRGISVYDIIDVGLMDEYINNNSHSDCVYVENNNVLTLKK